MTTITAVSGTEVIVNNNGRAVRVPVAKLMAVDAEVAAYAQQAVRFIGDTIKVHGDNRKPRHARVHGLLQ
jgi:hypothetical protein